jgi:hypothetical protein
MAVVARRGQGRHDGSDRLMEPIHRGTLFDQTPDVDEGSAEFSPCGLYRYTLRRAWGVAPPVLFVMLNPSTATAEQDDPTIRRCIGFARQWGAGGLLVANLYALRSTDPRGLSAVPDPVGPDNDSWIQRLAGTSLRVIVAWGAAPGPDPARPQRVRSVLRSVGVEELWALGLSRSGAPRHPLYMPKASSPVRWL